MTLFAWSTPERRSEERGVLLIIPNEIYFYIFEYLAPSTGRPNQDELLTFAMLSRVCRLFANLCLPRTFEYLEFSSSRERRPSDDVVYTASRATTLMSQIVAKQPLALSLAPSVRACVFKNDGTFQSADRTKALTPREHLTGMSHMSHLRQLTFSSSLVDEHHWQAVVSLPSLEQLCFSWCEFLDRPADAALVERVKLKVPRLEMAHCTGSLPPVIPVDAAYSRALSMDAWILKGLDAASWLPQSALTDLAIGTYDAPHWDWESQIWDMHDILQRAPQSIEVLSLCVDVYTGPVHVVFQRVFDTPAWSRFPHLRSLAFHVSRGALQTDENVLCRVLEGIRPLTSLQSCLLVNLDCVRAPGMVARGIRAMLRKKLRPQSHLTHINVFGKALRLVDGAWSEMVDSDDTPDDLKSQCQLS
ncbi:hypothetical protein JVU11DRAFT_7949 [Chiua virens]|nr:hypothetical protein JVU11DRAFT_7949 [Chiua virens]